MTAVATLSTTEVIASANELLSAHSALLSNLRTKQQQQRRQLHSLQPPPNEVLRLPLLPSPSPSPPPPDEDNEQHHEEGSSTSPPKRVLRADLPPIKRARALRYLNYIPEEETIRNDYSQRYVDSGEWPQNWVLGAEPERRFEEYPKQQRLLNLKKASVNNHSLPPSYLPYSQLSTLNSSKFDVILLDPPFSSSFTWDNLQELPIPSLAADPSFVFLWVGSGAGEGLERGREVLAKWGYRRCEDVVWVKTNKTTNQGPGTDPPTTSLLTRTKQHCLMGIRGTVRRSTDSWFVHCNVDTDVIIWEGDPTDPTRKPPEMYTLIENFCLGIRRLEIFGRPSSLRRGWVTVLGPNQDEQLETLEDGTVHVAGKEGGRGSLWTQHDWDEGIKELVAAGNPGGVAGVVGSGKPVVPMTSEIDALRPKSPVRPGQNAAGHHHHGSTGGGGGVGGGVGGLPPNPMTGHATPMQLPPRFSAGGSGGGRGFGGMGTSGGTMMGPPGAAAGRGGVGGMGGPGGQPMVPMGVQQMMGVNDIMGAAWNNLTSMNNLNNMSNMGAMNPGMGMGVGVPGMMPMVGVDPGTLAGMNNMGGMNMQGIQPGGGGGMGVNVNAMGMGGPQMGMLNQMAAAGQMSMHDGFGQHPQGMPGMFNPGMGAWGGGGGGDGQFGMEGGHGQWDGGQGVVPNMMGAAGGMNMQGMQGMHGMGMGQWGHGGPQGNF